MSEKLNSSSETLTSPPVKPHKAGPHSGWVLSDTVPWTDAVADFLRQSLGASEPKTQNYYRLNLLRLAKWADAQNVALADFRVRHMREYVAVRSETRTGRGEGGSVCARTVRHDVICARVFLRFCAAEGYVPSDPLSAYTTPKAPKPFVQCPNQEEVARLLKGVHDRWSPSTNPKARYAPTKARTFLARRDYAIFAGLTDTACRIGEMLALRLADYDGERITFRTTKTDTPRTVPISPEWRKAVEDYLRVRPKSVTSPLLFVSRTGGPLSVTAFGEQFRGYADFAGLSGWSLHGLRHYALTRIAEVDVLAAQRIAGHTSLVVTQGYLHARDERVRAAHAEAGPLSRVLLVNKRPQKHGTRKV